MTQALKASDFIPDVCENNLEINSIQRGDIIISGHRDQWLRLHSQNILFALIPKKTSVPLSCLHGWCEWIVLFTWSRYMLQLSSTASLFHSFDLFEKEKKYLGLFKTLFDQPYSLLTRHRPQLTINRQVVSGWLHVPDVLCMRLKNAVMSPEQLSACIVWTAHSADAVRIVNSLYSDCNCSDFSLYISSVVLVVLHIISISVARLTAALLGCSLFSSLSSVFTFIRTFREQ